MSAMASEFAEHCRAFFGVNHAHSEGHGKVPPARYAPGGAQS